MFACFLCCRVITFYAPTLKQSKFYSFLRFGRKSHGNTNVFVEMLLPVQFKAVLKSEPEYGRFCSVIVRPIASVQRYLGRPRKLQQAPAEPRSRVVPFMPVTPSCISADVIHCTSVGGFAEYLRR